MPEADRERRELLTEEERRGLDDVRAVWSSGAGETPEALRDLLEELRADGEPFEALERALTGGEWDPLRNLLRTGGAKLARAGTPFERWYASVSALRREVTRQLVEAHGDSPDRLGRALAGLDRLADLFASDVGRSFFEQKHRTTLEHEASARELSTPVLPVEEGLLVLPIVGIVDSRRAQEFTESLLHAVREHRARIAVVDVTGVPNVDSAVANHLVQTTEAARLMGAEAIITGIGANVAQTLAGLGIDLGQLRTACDLQRGIEDARAALRRGSPSRVRPEAAGDGECAFRS